MKTANQFPPRPVLVGPFSGECFHSPGAAVSFSTLKTFAFILLAVLPAFAQTTNIVRTTNLVPVVSEIRTVTFPPVTNTVTIYVTNAPPVVVLPPATNPPVVIVPPSTNMNQGLRLEFEIAPVAGKNPQGVAVATGQVTVVGDWQWGTHGSLHFYFNSAHYGADQGARRVTYTLPAPDGAWHKITAEYDLQFVTITRDGVQVVREWLDSDTTEIPRK